MKKFSEERKEYIRYGAVALISTAVFLVLMSFFIGFGFGDRNPYNSYTLQAVSWLKGRLDLGRDYSHLELAFFEGKYYVSFPPFPSFVMLPFALFMGENTPDYLILFIFNLLGVLYLYRTAVYFKLSPVKSLISTLFVFLGSNLIFPMLTPYVWFIAQVMSFALSLMSIYYALNNKAGLSLALWACAVGCRPMQIAFIPVLLYIIIRRNYESEEHEKDFSFLSALKLIVYRWKAVIPATLIAGVYMLLNYLRFGNPLQFGHDYLPEFVNSEYGQFSLHYVRQNLESLFRNIRFDHEGRMVIDHFNNISMLIITPLFVMVFVAMIAFLIIGLKDGSYGSIAYKCFGIIVCSVIYMFMIVMHATLGGWHFGNRYSNGIIPYFYLALMLLTSKEERLIKWEIPLLVWAIVLNSVGTVVVYNGL